MDNSIVDELSMVFYISHSETRVLSENQHIGLVRDTLLHCPWTKGHQDDLNGIAEMRGSRRLDSALNAYELSLLGEIL
jgi:hypothetical protein